MVVEQFLLVDENENDQILVEFALKTNLIWKILIVLNGRVPAITKVRRIRVDKISLVFLTLDFSKLKISKVLKLARSAYFKSIIFVANTIHSILQVRAKTIIERTIIKSCNIGNSKFQTASICKSG